MAEAVRNLQTLTALNCAACSMEFAIPSDFMERRRQDHKEFYCPSGHINIYKGETEKERLQRELIVAQRRAEMEATGRREAERQAKRATTAKRKLMERVNCGVCPHCQRTVSQLAAHIKTKHPGVIRS